MDIRCCRSPNLPSIWSVHVDHRGERPLAVHQPPHQPLLQAAARHVVHQHVAESGIGISPYVIHADEIRVAHRHRDLRLADEPLDKILPFRRRLRIHHLGGELGAVPRIAHEIHRAHPAMPKFAHHIIEPELVTDLQEIFRLRHHFLFELPPDDDWPLIFDQSIFLNPFSLIKSGPIQTRKG